MRPEAGKNEGVSKLLLDAFAMPAASELKELELRSSAKLKPDRRRVPVVAECARREIEFTFP